MHPISRHHRERCLTATAATLTLILGVMMTSPAYGNVTLIFRLDDYCARSDTAFETKFIDVFATRRLPLVIGVIPRVVGGPEDATLTGPFHNPDRDDFMELTPEKAAILRRGVDAGIMEVALHGYTHRTLERRHYRGFDRVDHSEFQRAPFEDQLERLRAGKAFLESILGHEVSAFIPPWNKVDATTVRALETSGFKILSADLGFDNVRTESPLAFVPGTAKLLELPDAVKAARKAPGDAIVVVVIHQFDFIGVNAERGVIDFDAFEELLDWVVEQRDVKVRTFGDVMEQRLDLGPARLHANHGLFTAAKLLPTPLADRVVHGGALLALDQASSVRTYMWLIVISFYAAVIIAGLLAAYGIGVLIRPFAPGLLTLTKYAVFVLTLAVCLYSIRGDLHFMGMSASALLLGVCVGVWCASTQSGKARLGQKLE